MHHNEKKINNKAGFLLGNFCFIIGKNKVINAALTQFIVAANDKTFGWAIYDK